MTDKQLLEQALEALEEFGTHYYHCPQYPTFAQPTLEPPCDCGLDAAITALRTAIEQAEKRKQEPVAIHCKAKRENHGVCPHHNLQCGWPKCNEPPVAHVQKLADCCANCLRPEHEHQEGRCPKPFTTVWHAWDYDFPPAAPVQEPVAQAWDEGYCAGIDDERTSEANIGIAGFDAKVEPARNNPYRTTPPAAQRQWVGLDKEEIKRAPHHMVDGAYHYSFKQGAEWAEAKLKEKNT